MPLLVLCNKLDMVGALQPADIAVQTGLSKITGRPYQLQGCVALTGYNVLVGIGYRVPGSVCWWVRAELLHLSNPAALQEGVQWLLGAVRRRL